MAGISSVLLTKTFKHNLTKGLINSVFVLKYTYFLLLMIVIFHILKKSISYKDKTNSECSLDDFAFMKVLCCAMLHAEYLPISSRSD